MRRMVFAQPRAALSEKLLAESAGHVLAFIDTAPLQFGNDEVNKICEAFRRNGISKIEAVDVGVADP